LLLDGGGEDLPQQVASAGEQQEFAGLDHLAIGGRVGGAFEFLGERFDLFEDELLESGFSSGDWGTVIPP
jgi:hypothetical protein